MFWAVICVSAMLLWQVGRSTPDDRKIPEIDYSRFMSDVDAGNVASVDITGTRIQGQYRDAKGAFRLIGPSNPGVYLDALRNKGVEIRFRDGGQQFGSLTIAGNVGTTDSVGRTVVLYDPTDAEKAFDSAGRHPARRREFGIPY